MTRGPRYTQSPAIRCYAVSDHIVKKPKLPKPKKVRRNPHARALASPLFQSRVVKGPGVYRRRSKHQKAVRADEEA